MESFSSFFIENPGQPYPFEGELVWSSLPIPVTKGTTLRITVREHIRKPRQIVAFSAKNCLLKFAVEEVKKAYIHADSKPTCYLVELSNVGEAATVRIWNAWRSKHNEVEFGLNFAGLIYEKIQNQESIIYHCKCSDGIGEPDFRSLVFDCEVLSKSPRSAKT